MKKILVGCGIVCFLCMLAVGGCIALLFLSGSDSQKEFYDAMATGDAKNVMALFTPELKNEVDEPVLAVWIKAFNENLGAYKGMSATDFSTSSKIENGATLYETKGTATFEKGDAKSMLKYVNGKINAFNIDSDKMPKDFFKGPASTELYRARGKEFIEKALGGKVSDAWNMMHSALQEKVPLDRLKQMMEKDLSASGYLKSVKFGSEESVTGPPYELKVFFDVVGEKGGFRALVRFEFSHVKGHLLGFDFGVN